MQSTRLGPLGAAALLLVMCGVTACAPPSLRELAQSAGGAVEAAASVMRPSPPSSGDALLDFLAGAEEGEARELEDSATGIRLRVTAGRAYHAASGRLCRRYIAVSTAIPGEDEEGLVCEGTNGYWARAGLLAPVSP